MSAENNPVIGRMPEIIHHAANCGSQAIPNTLAAVTGCLSVGAQFIEVDIIPLAGGDFALLHDQTLETSTTGRGRVAAATAGQVQSLFYQQGGRSTGVPVTLLSQVLALLQAPNDLARLQLDLKPYAPLTPPVLQGLVELVEPYKDRVQVSCVADWAVRQLRSIDPDLALGFDPLLYLDLERSEPRPEGVPPFRVGAYGYRDDHPLASEHWGPEGAYLAARAEALLVQAPPQVMWYINAPLLLRALQAGFDWIGYLHANGSRVAAWTLDVTHSEGVVWAEMLSRQGVDAITSNNPAQMAQALLSRFS